MSFRGFVLVTSLVLIVLMSMVGLTNPFAIAASVKGILALLIVAAVLLSLARHLGQEEDGTVSFKGAVFVLALLLVVLLSVVGGADGYVSAETATKGILVCSVLALVLTATQVLAKKD